MAFLFNDADLKKPVLKHVMNKENAINCRTIWISKFWIDLTAKNSKLAEEICGAILDKKDNQSD